MPSDMSQYPRTNTASRPSEASIIGKDLTITGDVTSKGELRIDGRVQGNVHCLSLILGENPEIKGDVKAEDVLIGRTFAWLSPRPSGDIAIDCSRRRRFAAQRPGRGHISKASHVAPKVRSLLPN